MDYFLPFYLPNSPKNQNFKIIKKRLEMSSSHICVPKNMIRDVRFLRYGARRMDGQTEGRKKWHIEVGAPPKMYGVSKYGLVPYCWKKYYLKLLNCSPSIFLLVSLFVSFISSKGKDTSAIPQPSIQHLVYVFPIFFRFHKFFVEACVSS